VFSFHFLLFRLPGIVVGGLRFYLDSVFFFRQLPSQLAKRNSTKTGHMIGSKCDLKLHIRNLGYPFSLKIEAEAQNLSFFDAQLNGNFNGLYVFGTQHDIRNRR